MSNRKGIFVTFEGIDGSGKSSIAKEVNNLIGLFHHTVHTREPGGTDLGEKIRELILHEEMDAIPELLLLYASRYDHYHKLIKPSVDEGKIVLCERFIDSSMVFQGYGKGLTEQVKLLNKDFMGSAVPDRTYIIDVPYPVAKSRMTERTKDRFENMPDSYHEQNRNSYLTIAASDPKRCVVVDNTGKMSDIVLLIASDIVDTLKKINKDN